MDARRSQRLFDPLFTTETMRGIFSDHGRLQAMLDFEAALARAEARAGLVPAAAAAAIGAQCRAELFDVDALAAVAAQAGNSAIPLVRQLTRLVAARDAEAARYVHWGATSQDVMDTGLVLQLCSALTAIDADLARLSSALATLAKVHAQTPLAGRTWLQQGPPVTLGLKAAGFLSAIERHRIRLAEVRGRVATLQFGGAVGTLAALGERGMDVASALAEELQLALPDVPWHAQRDRLAEVATTLGLVVGTLGKLARDVSLLMQTEVAEAFEPSAPGRGGSSTMPHKRNPVGAVRARASARSARAAAGVLLEAMAGEHERAAGAWHSEWRALSEALAGAGGAAWALHEGLSGLTVDPERMRANLDLTGGALLAEHVALLTGERDAVERALREGRPLADLLRGDLGLGDEEIARALDPAHYLGAADAFIDRALELA